jgi:hypothetical protein
MGVMKSWDGTAYPVGLTGTYYYYLDSNYSFTGSIGYFRYCTKPNASIFSDYGHTVMPFSIGARYSFKQGDFRMYAGAELGVVSLSNNISSSFYEWDVFEKPSNHPLSLSPLLGFISKMNDRIDLDVNLKYFIISTGSCIILNAGIKFPL